MASNNALRLNVRAYAELGIVPWSNPSAINPCCLIKSATTVFFLVSALASKTPATDVKISLTDELEGACKATPSNTGAADCKVGVDCWGLVRLIYSKEFNVDLPSFVGEYAEDDAERQAELIAINQEGWRLADSPIPGDVVLFKILGKASHVGIYLGEEKFLHTLDNYASAIERLTILS